MTSQAQQWKPNPAASLEKVETDEEDEELHVEEPPAALVATGVLEPLGLLQSTTLNQTVTFQQNILKAFVEALHQQLRDRMTTLIDFLLTNDGNVKLECPSDQCGSP